MAKNKKRTRTISKEIISDLINSHNTLNDAEMLKILEEDVFNDFNFKRHLKETSIKLEVPEDVVESVIKHYLTFICLEMIKIRKFKRRIVIYGFFFLDVIEPYYSPKSKYFKGYIKKHFPSIKLKNLINKKK